MADKTYEIEIKTTSDTSGVTSVKEALSEAKEEAEEVSASMEGMGESIGDIDSSSIDELNEKTQEVNDSTSDASDSTDNLSESVNNIDHSSVDELKDSMGEYRESVSESADATNNLMEGLVSGGLATGLGNTFMGLANKAGDYNDSVLRMGLSLEGHAMTVDEVNAKYGKSISRLAEETGRGGGSIRNHFANMGVAGIKNQEILEGSFQAIANGSFYSGESIETLSNKFQRISMTGMLSAKQLSGLGLTMEDLAKVMGVSAEDVSKTFKTMSAEQRASVMSQASASKYGTEVNDVFKQSWEGLWTQMDKGSAGLQRLVGELLIPYLIPAVKTATLIIDQLTSTFKTLPQPVKDIMGGFMVFGTGISTIGLGLNALIKMGGLIFSPFNSIAKLFGVDLTKEAKKLATVLKGNLSTAFDGLKMKASSVATTIKTTVTGAFRTISNFAKTQLIPALKSAGTSLLTMGKNALISGYNALKSAGMWMVEKAQTVASTLARWGATASQWALNVAMSMNPIGIIIIAIVGLIAVLGYLYFNNEQVRQAIDGLGQTLIAVGQIMYTALAGAIDWIIQGLQNLWNYIITLGGLLPTNVSITGNQIVDTVLRVLAFIGTLPMQIAMIFTNIIAKALGFGDNFAQRMMTGARTSVSHFINQITQLPSKLSAELNNMLSIVGEWASTLPQKFWDAGVNAVKNFLNALDMHSPGIMQRKLLWEVSEMGRRVPLESRNLLSNIKDLGTGVVDEFGNPQLSIGSDIKTGSHDNIGGSQTINFNFNGVVIDNDERMEKIYDYITKRLHWNNATAGRSV